MRPKRDPPVDAATLGQMWIQVLVREYPELLEVIESRGIDGGALACSPASDLEAIAPGLHEAIEEAMAWRFGNLNRARTRR